MKRTTYFDGLRGLACLQVVLGHYTVFAPKYGGALGFLANGNSAVFVFFLMSGYVLSGSFSKDPVGIFNNGCRRVVRLAVPALAAVVFAAALDTMGHQAARNAVAISGSAWFSGVTALPSATALWSDLSLASIIGGYQDASLFSWPMALKMGNAIDLPLWTLHVELWGSFWILLLIRLKRYSTPIYRATLIGSIYLIGINELSMFTIGHLCFSAVQSARGPSLTNSKITRTLGIFSLIIGIVLCSQHIFEAFLIEALFLPPGLLHTFSWFSWQIELGSILIFIGVLRLPFFQKLLDRRLPQYLGRLSFSIYLLHWPVMISAGSAVFLAALPLGHITAAMFAVVVGLALTLGVAAWFEQYIDAPIVRLSRRLKLSSGRRATESATPS